MMTLQLFDDPNGRLLASVLVATPTELPDRTLVYAVRQPTQGMRSGAGHWIRLIDVDGIEVGCGLSDTINVRAGAPL